MRARAATSASGVVSFVRAGGVLVASALACLLPRPVHAQPPPAVDAGVVLPGIVGEAPIAAGNVASARARALDEAFRQLVERAYGGLIGEIGGAATAAQAGVRASWLQRPRRLVRAWKVLEESEQAGLLRVRISAELDEAGMRRELERARGPAAPRGVPAGAVPVATLGTPESAVALTSALIAGGVRAELAPGRLAEAGAAGPLAERSGRGVAIVVNGRGADEGRVRGGGVRAFACEVEVRLITPGGAASGGDRTGKARAFDPDANRARDLCYGRAVAGIVPALLPELGSLAGGAGDLRAYTLDLDLNEPAALAPVLRAARKVAGPASAEVRRIAVGRVEIAISTRLAAPALLAGIARELGPVATLVRTGSGAGDRLTAQVRLLAEPPPAPPPPAMGPAPAPPPTGAAAPQPAPR